MNTKKIKLWAAGAVFAGMFVYILTLSLLNRSLSEKYETEVTNNKALLAQIDKNRKDVIVFQTTISDLETAKDSISEKMISIKNELGIKNKQIKQLNYLATEFKKTDTIVLNDTIFREPDFSIDTIIGNRWVNTHLTMTYPNSITLEPTAVSEKNVILYSHKETVKPEKKFFLLRWFQKKHTVIHAIVNEQNPYITNQTNTFIEIKK